MTPIRQAKSVLLLLLLAQMALAAGCDGEADQAEPIPGGEIGSLCTTDGQPGCTPDGAAAVRCSGGIWQSMQSCEPGMGCRWQSDAGVAAASCEKRYTTHPQLALACAKAVACGTGRAFLVDECVGRYGSATAGWPASAKSTEPVSFDELRERDWPTSVQACYQAAGTCEAVGQCESSPDPTCGAGGETCVGNAIRHCEDGRSSQLVCPSSLECREFLDTAFCLKPASCGGSLVSCVGNVAHICPAGLSFGYQVDCSLRGETCSPSADASNRPCVPPRVETCEDATFEPRCSGDVVLQCWDGEVYQKDCAAVGQTCAEEEGFIGADCVSVADSACASPYCDGSDLLFCQSGTLVRLDCAAYGMACGKGEVGVYATCVFAK